MPKSWKNILLFILLISLGLGVGYLGMKIINLDRSSTGVADSAPAETPLPPSTETPLASETPVATISTQKSVALSAAKNCVTSAECTVISEPGTYLDGRQATINYCLNRSYLDACPDCYEDPGFQQELAKEKICTCLDQTCQYPAGSTP